MLLEAYALEGSNDVKSGEAMVADQLLSIINGTDLEPPQILGRLFSPLANAVQLPDTVLSLTVPVGSLTYKLNETAGNGRFSGWYVATHNGRIVYVSAIRPSESRVALIPISGKLNRWQSFLPYVSALWIPLAVVSGLLRIWSKRSELKLERAKEIVAVLFAVELSGWILTYQTWDPSLATRVPDFTRLFVGVGQSLTIACGGGVLYLASLGYCNRHWDALSHDELPGRCRHPLSTLQRLVESRRTLKRRLADPELGRQLVIGLALGAMLTLYLGSEELLVAVLNRFQNVPWHVMDDLNIGTANGALERSDTACAVTWSGPLSQIGFVLSVACRAVVFALAHLGAVAILTYPVQLVMITRDSRRIRTLAMFVYAVLLGSAIGQAIGETRLSGLVMWVPFVLLLMYVLEKFGVIALSAVITSVLLLTQLPLPNGSTFSSQNIVGVAVVVTLILLGIAISGLLTPNRDLPPALAT